jgi:carbon storage regulator
LKSEAKMLILKRKIDEEIKIGSDITIKILSIADNQVKIGIEAPKSVEVYRSEIFEKVKENVIVATERSKDTLQNVASLKLTKYVNSGNEQKKY